MILLALIIVGLTTFGLLYLILFDTETNKEDTELYKKITSADRGTPSERHLVSTLLSSGFKPTAIYHDLIVKSVDGKTSQIDIVVATNVGLIVIEVKDYIGWIFGKGNEEYWTQKAGYCGKYVNNFYNPFKQNESHIKALHSLSPQMAALPMYSLVVFAGECKLRNITYIPRDSYLATSDKAISAIYDIIKTHPPFLFQDKWEVVNLLKAAVKRGGVANEQQQHIAGIQDMLGTNRIYE